MRAFVIHSKALGLFLGIKMSMTGGRIGVWTSSPNTIWVPDHAVCFHNVEAAMTFADDFEPPPEGLEVLEVDADVDDGDGTWYISRAACVKAGLPTWIDAATETANGMPI